MNFLLSFGRNICPWSGVITCLYRTIDLCFFDDKVQRRRKMRSFRCGSSMFSSSRCSVLGNWSKIRIKGEHYFLKFGNEDRDYNGYLITIRARISTFRSFDRNIFDKFKIRSFHVRIRRGTRCGFAFVRFWDPLGFGFRWPFSLFAGDFRCGLDSSLSTLKIQEQIHLEFSELDFDR